MKILRCLFFFYMFIFKIDAFSAVIYGPYGNEINEINNQELPFQLLTSDNDSLSSPYDTAGPSFTLAIGTSSERIIRAIEMRSGQGVAVGYFSSATCASGLLGNAAGLINGTTFTFTDNTPIFFGTTALSALSANNTSTQCIMLGLTQNTGGAGAAFIFLQIQNLTCNGTTCTGGNVCYTTPGPNQWSASSTPAC